MNFSNIIKQVVEKLEGVSTHQESVSFVKNGRKFVVCDNDY